MVWGDSGEEKLWDLELSEWEDRGRKKGEEEKEREEEVEVEEVASSVARGTHFGAGMVEVVQDLRKLQCSTGWEAGEPWASMPSPAAEILASGKCVLPVSVLVANAPSVAPVPASSKLPLQCSYDSSLQQVCPPVFCYYRLQQAYPPMHLFPVISEEPPDMSNLFFLFS